MRPTAVWAVGSLVLLVGFLALPRLPAYARVIPWEAHVVGFVCILAALLFVTRCRSCGLSVALKYVAGAPWPFSYRWAYVHPGGKCSRCGGDI